jgi:hypothetical protein
MQMRLQVAILLMAVRAAAGAEQKPSAEEQARLLEQVREAALSYTRSLPDFICTQIVKRYADATGRDRWTPIDTLTVKLSYFGQKEDYKLLSIDNKPTNLEYMKAGGAASKGEFGTVLSMVFDPKSAAGFQWNSWTTIRKRRAAVYSYRVERAHSEYVVSVQVDRDRLRETLVGYHGEIFADRETNMVLRMTTVAEVPAGFPMRQAVTSLDYDFTEVGGREYLLPLKAEVEMWSTRLHTRNSVGFHSYQKFQSETTILFGTDEDKPKAAPGKH